MKTIFLNKIKFSADKIRDRTIQRIGYFQIEGSEKNHNIKLKELGNKSVLYYEEVYGDTKEKYTLKLDSFKDAFTIFEKMGLINTSYQEYYQELYKKNNVLLAYEQWPGLPIVTKIFGDSAKEVNKIIEELGLEKKDSIGPSIEDLYNLNYQIEKDILLYIPNLTFETINDVLKNITKSRRKKDSDDKPVVRRRRPDGSLVVSSS